MDDAPSADTMALVCAAFDERMRLAPGTILRDVERRFVDHAYAGIAVRTARMIQGAPAMAEPATNDLVRFMRAAIELVLSCPETAKRVGALMSRPE